MTDFTFTSDPRLPENVVVAQTPAGLDKYFIEHGEREHDGKKGASITDMQPDHDDPNVTEMDYAFVYADGIFIHEMTGIHRHGPGGDPDGGHGECEHTPAPENPAPDEVVELLNDYFDAPAAARTGDDEDE